MKERFQGSDYRFLAICLALAGVAIWYSAGNFYRAFPEASIDFRVNREQGRALAQRFLASRQFSLAGYREAARFEYDDQAKTFLEREAGLERANQLLSTRIRLWRWSYRWFRPQQKEEFHADLTPRGDVTGFWHELPEDAARPTLGAAQARLLAEDFLRTTAHRDPAALDFVEVSENIRPHRTDRTYEWKERDFNLHDATYRYWVTVLGDEIGGFNEFLKVPEKWQRDYQTLRSRNETAQNVDQAFMALLMLGMLAVLVMRIRKQDVRWRRAAWIGLGGMALAFCASLNGFPLQEFGFRTTDSYGSFLTRELINALADALSVGGFLFLMSAGAEPLYREAYGGQVSIGNLFRLRGLRTRRFFKGAILGATLACIFIAYQTIFYTTAYKLGAWSPADVPYSDELNTAFPWLFVLFGGYFPAVFEEFTFRMFAIPFFRKLVKWLPAAVVMAGFLWGFGHSSYPQQPFFIRGVEVGIGGVALGIIMLRWGILPTLVWHYSVDALYSAMLMLRSHSLYFKLSGAASAGIVVLPIVIALAAYWKRGGFDPVEGLLNSDEPGPVEAPAVAAPVAAAEAPSYAGLGTRARLIAVGLFVLGLAALLVPVDRFGQRPQFKLNAASALASADAFVRAQGIDPAQFRHVVSTGDRDSDERLAWKYFLERVPLSRASQLVERYRPVRYWLVRYFRPMDQEGLYVAVHPETGAVTGFSHSIPEEQPGADISEAAARQIADAFAGQRGIDLSTMDLKENNSEKKKARRDYSLVWEARAGDARNVDEAHYRIGIDIAGYHVTGWHAFWKLPETFSRARQRQNWISISVEGLRIAMGVLIVVWGLWMTIRNIRRGLVPWGVALRIAAPAAVLGAIGSLLRLPQAYENYNTTMPLATFQANTGISELMGLMGGLVGFGAAAVLLTSFFPDCVDAFRAARRRWTAIDAVAATLAAAGVALVTARVELLLNARFHAQALLDAGAPSLIESLSPAVTALANAATTVVSTAAMLALIILIYLRLPRAWVGAAAVLLIVCAVSDQARTLPEFALSYAEMALFAGAAFALCRWLGRDNYLAYALAMWVAGIRSASGELLDNPNSGYQVQGWIVVICGLAVVAWLAAPAARREPQVEAASAA